MRKFTLIFIVFCLFFLVSCSSSKNPNDTDILPDSDINTQDSETVDADSDTQNSEIIDDSDECLSRMRIKI